MRALSMLLIASALWLVSTLMAQTPDTEPPTVKITYPVDERSAIHRKIPLVITVKALDNVGISEIVVSVNDEVLCRAPALPDGCTWVVPAPPRQRHVIHAVATDAAGNRAEDTVTVFTESAPQH